VQIELSVNFERDAMANRNEDHPILYTNVITLRMNSSIWKQYIDTGWTQK